MKRKHTPTWKLPVLFCLIGFVLAAMPAQAQDDSDVSFSVSLVSDQFFGFAPAISGAYKVSPVVDLTFYGIFWSGGTGGAWGNWTEFGIGANFNVADGFSINPNLGVTGGNLLSAGAAAGSPSIFGDGIVPNLILALDKSGVEGEVYFGYYAPLRDKAPETGSTHAYVHYWASLGYQASPAVSFGAHFEHLLGGPTSASTMPDAFQWIGPYIQFSVPKYGAFTRLAAGGDLVSGNDSFFKLSAGFSF